MVMKSVREVGGYVLMNDLTVPHDSFFRPPAGRWRRWATGPTSRCRRSAP